MDYISSRIELGVDLWRQRIDCRVQLLLDLDYILLISLGDEVDCEADLSVATTSSNSVQVGLYA